MITFSSGGSAVWLAHMVWDHGVVGSNPTSPTILSFIEAKIEAKIEEASFVWQDIKKLRRKI